jgi:ABC-2 type transport system permease protein
MDRADGSAQVQALRFRAAAIDPVLVAKLTRPVGVDELGLVERDSSGEVRPAAKVDRVRTMAVPLVLMMLIFMPVMIICPQLVQSVLEEKMSRISEVLLGSVTPFELMLGKLLGAGGVCVVITLSYVGAAAVAAVYWGYADVIAPVLIIEFVIFLALAMLLYGSLYIAVGAASTTMKDSQGLMMPVMMLSMIPIFAVSVITRAPEGPLAIGLSLFPPSAPYLMMFRLATHPGPAVWQVLLAVALTAATAVGGVWAAGRIFRVGLLMQGKTPSFGELITWVRA